MEGERAAPPTLFQHVEDSGGDLLSKIAGCSGRGLRAPVFGSACRHTVIPPRRDPGLETGLYVVGIVGGG